MSVRLNDMNERTGRHDRILILMVAALAAVLALSFLVSGRALAADPPTMTGIAPLSAYNNAPVTITDLAGTNFASGATAKLTRSGYPDIDGTSVVVVSSTKITCLFPIAYKAAGLWNVVVTNVDEQSGTFENGFEVVQQDYMSIVAPSDLGSLLFHPGSDNEYTADDAHTRVTCSANVDYDVKVNGDTDANKTSAFMWEWNGTSYVPSGRRLSAAMSMKAPGGTYTAITASPTAISGFTSKPPGEGVVTYVDWKQPAGYGDVPLGGNTYRQVLTYTIAEHIL